MGFSANISQCEVYELVIVYSFCTAFLTFIVSFIWLQFLLKEEYNNWISMTGREDLMVGTSREGAQEIATRSQRGAQFNND